MWWLLPLLVLIHDPGDPNESFYNSLTRPDVPGASCCAGSKDCKSVEWRVGPEGYEALVDKRWIKVPNTKVIKNRSNPTGSAVLCHSSFENPNGSINVNIYCFIPASET